MNKHDSGLFTLKKMDNEHIRIMLAIKEQLINSITPYKAPEIVKDILAICNAIDDYIANPSEECYKKIENMLSVLDSKM